MKIEGFILFTTLLFLTACQRNESEYYGYAKKEDTNPSKKITLSNSEQLSNSIQNGNWPFLEKQIEGGLSVNFILDSGRTLLNESIQWDQEVIFKNLLQLGADPKIKDQTFVDAFEMAAEKISFIVILDPSRFAGFQKELIEYLESEDNDEIKRLLEQKIDPNFLMASGESPLTHAISNNLENTVRIFINAQYKTDIYFKNSSNLSPLALSKKLNLKRIEKLLIGRGAEH